MRLSISSSEPSCWITSWVIAFTLASLALLTVEHYWRTRGYYPNILDSAQLWSLQRDRIYSRTRTPLVIIGASRIQFGVDLKRMKSLLPNYQIAMLATNGRYPLAVLRDLADDEHFSGTVLCDISSHGLTKLFRDMMQDYVHYYHTQWTPSWRFHRRLLSVWQRTALIANPDFSAVASLQNWLSHNQPFHPYYRFYSNRSADVDFSKTDTLALSRHFETTAQEDITNQSPPAPNQWLNDLSDVESWVAAIQRRGGKVIFYQTPTSGKLRQIEDIAFPRAQYWDAFAASTQAQTLHYSDEPALASIELPDQSHLDFRTKATYTDALVDTLLRRGLLLNP